MNNLWAALVCSEIFAVISEFKRSTQSTVHVLCGIYFNTWGENGVYNRSGRNAGIDGHSIVSRNAGIDKPGGGKQWEHLKCRKYLE